MNALALFSEVWSIRGTICPCQWEVWHVVGGGFIHKRPT